MIPIAVSPVHAAVDTAPTISPQSGEFAPGQTIVLTVTGSASGAGTLTLYNEPGPTCIGAASGTPIGLPYSVLAAGTYSNPWSVATTAATSGWFCAVFVDAAGTFTSGVTSYTISTIPLTSYNTNEAEHVRIDLGQSVVLTDYPSGGAPPYSFYWYAGATCGGSTPATGPAAGDLQGPNAAGGYVNSASFTAVTPAATGSFSVFVVDSTFGTPLIATCEPVLVTVNPDITGTFTVGGLTGEINDQAGAGSLQAVVTWTGGTGPWYNVQILAGTESTCSNLKTVAHINDVNGTEAILTFPEPSTPSTSTYYCALITDSSVGVPPTAVYLPSTGIGILVNVNPALSAPIIAYTGSSPEATDYGVTPTPNSISFTVTWSGGTSPYTVWVVQGSQKSCSVEDGAPVVGALTAIDYAQTLTGYSYVYNGLTYTLFTTGIGLPAAMGVGATQMTFTVTPAPTVTTYYCALVIDSSAPSQSVTYTASPIEFTVESLFATNAPTLSTYATEVLNPQYEGQPVTATVSWSGGTGPYIVSLYQNTLAGLGTTASPYYCPTTGATLVNTSPSFNPQTGVTGTSASFTFISPNAIGNYCYYDTVTDINGNTVSSLFNLVTPPPTDTGGFAVLSVAASFSAVTLTVVPTPPLPPTSGIDVGQTEPLTATVAFAGGNAPYTVTLYEGVSPSCSLDTSTVKAIAPTTNPVVVTASPATFKFTSPTADSFFCAKVADSSVPASVAISSPVPFLVNPPPAVVLPLGYEIAAGTSTTLTAVGSGGVAPLYYQWFIGTSTCAAADAVTTPSLSATYSTGVISTNTVYSVQVTDSSAGTPAASACATITITVNNGPMGIAVVGTAFGAPSQAGEIFVANPSSYNSPGTSNSVSVIDSDSNSVVTNIPLTADGGLCTLSPTGGIAYATEPLVDDMFVAGTVTGPYVVTAASTFTSAPLPITGGYILTDTAQTFTAAMVGMYIYDSTTSSYAQITSLYPTTATTSTQVVVTTFTPALPAPASGNTYQVYSAITSPLSVCPYAMAGTGWVDDISVPTNTLFASFPVGNNPQGIAYDYTLGLLYVANNGDNTVSVCSAFLDTCTGTGLGTVSVGPGPMGVAVDQSTHNVFVADNGGNTVSVLVPSLNPPTLYHVTTVNVGFEPVGVAVNAINDEVYVTNSGSGTVSVLNGFSFATLATIKVGGMPTGIDINYVSPTQAYAYVANAATNAVTVINLSTNAPLSSTIPVGSGPWGVAVDAPNNTVLVTNTGDNTVSAINLANNQVIATIVVP